MASHSRAANVLMVVLIVGGLVLSGRVERQNLPVVELQEIRISIPYPGASPSQVEEGVLLAVESSVEELDDVRRVDSSARQGIGTATAKLTSTSEPQDVLGKIKTAVDGIASFPSEVQEPRFRVLDNQPKVVSVVVSGAVPLRELEARGEAIRSKLRRLPQVASVETRGLPRREISVEVESSALRKYGVTTDQIARTIRDATNHLPAGDIEARQGSVLLETSPKETTPEFVASLPLLSAPDGSRIRIGGVAQVYRTYASPTVLAEFERNRAILFEVFSDSAYSPTETFNAVRDLVEVEREATEISVNYDLFNNLSILYRDRMESLRENGIAGFFLVLLTLALFLRPRVGFWTAIGLVTSYLGAVIFMPFFEISINGVSIFAFLVTIGLVVDDAIVVSDAIDVRQESGMEPVDGAIAGVRDVRRPLVFAVLTSILAFAPTLFVPGPLGQILPNIGVVVALVLAFSLVECLFILPAHLGHKGDREAPGWLRPFRRIQKQTVQFVRWFNEEHFKPLVRLAIRYRYITVTAAVGSVIVGVGLVSAGLVKFSFMPELSRWEVYCAVRTPAGTPIDETRRIASAFAEGARETSREFTPEGERPPMTGVLSIVGFADMFEGVDRSSNLATITADLTLPADRSVSTEEFTRRWRRKMEGYPGVENARFHFETGPAAGPDVNLKFSHPDASVLTQAADRLVEELQGRESLTGVESSVSSGPVKLRIRPKPVAEAMGLSAGELARQVRGAFFGSEADRLQEGEDELRIKVRRPREARKSLHSLREMVVSLPGGGEMPLTEAARLERSHAETFIERESGVRIARVTGNVVGEDETGAAVTSRLYDEVIPQIKEEFPDLNLGVGGIERQRQRSLSYLAYAYIVVLILITGLLAIGLDSYLQPFLVMSVLPFGLVGAILGHLLLGFHLSMVSLFGVVALSGIIVNDTVVLLDEANRRLDAQHPVDAIRKRSLQLYEALTEAASVRFRPVVLTSLTTFFGVAPLMFDSSPAVQFFIPLGVSLGFGVLAATAVTLLVLPALYLVVEDAAELFRSSDGFGE